MPPELGGKCATQCLNTMFLLLTASPAVCGMQREVDFDLIFNGNFIIYFHRLYLFLDITDFPT